MLSHTHNMPLIEKCKIAVWMENFQDIGKVQSKFLNEFCKYPPNGSTIIHIHNKFMTTGSVVETKDSSLPIITSTQDLLININSIDFNENNENQLSVKEKWKNRPKIKISKQHSNKTVSLIKEENNLEEIKEYAEISVSEQDYESLLDLPSISSDTSKEKLKKEQSDFFNCSDCIFTCNNTSQLRAHKAQCDKTKIISENSQKFIYKDEKLKEMISGSHENVNLVCDKCDCKFVSETSLQEHILMLHETERDKYNSLNVKDKPLVCNQCGYRTHRKSYLKNHLTIHSSDTSMKFACYVCQQKFKTSRTLKYHVDNFHTEKNFLECPFCDFRQKNKILLQIHIRRHTGEKPYKCSQKGCDFKARVSQELKKHLQKEHLLE